MPITNNLTEQDIQRLSDTLVSARKAQRALNEFPQPVPDTLEQAYQIQDLSMADYQDELVGWKVGVVPEHLREQYRAERLMGPIYKGLCHFLKAAHTNGEVLEVPIFAKGFAAVEAELIFEVAEDIAPGSVDTSAELTHLVKNVYAGIEIASSPVPDLNNYGPAAIISDFGNNNGMIVGAAIDNWQQTIANIQTQVWIDDKLINQAPANAVLNGPMAAFSYLIECCAEREISLKRGALICTGAITGVHEAKAGSCSTVDFGLAGQLNIKLTDFC
ncbi:hypothetical protein N7931_15375 [Catenovulum sp. 2E275]|uniref:2-keto-4-pentenoate hydratase n=1 Tax=Catenovulum sp. 2E275 TaxID=2980497 RepID=UPI0021CE61FB|nr:hypothetical protein [Catenovulum sp. 2E275]MCU4677014.1 hypothetical protein [Catenovulum sp. 2E275]